MRYKTMLELAVVLAMSSLSLAATYFSVEPLFLLVDPSSLGSKPAPIAVPLRMYSR